MSSLWDPTSDCGDHCLPVATQRVSLLRYWARLSAGFVLLLAFVLAKPFVARRPAVVKAFSRALLASLGLRLVVRGKFRPGLLVANHVSWVDVVLMMALDGKARLVSKREVRGWPVIGSLAATMGAIFIDRSSPRGLPGAVDRVAAALRAGGTVVVFPEATTTCGACRVPMRPAFFQAAVDAGARVTPVALGFRVGGVESTVAAFVGQDTLMASLRRMARTRELTITASAGRSLFAEPETDRRALARLAEVTVRNAPPVMIAQQATRDVSRVPLRFSGAPDYHGS
ncbi:1-acyl-sn-glycerol-3-phosphate acyltransferase [Allocatelliglobosispora scoriae]|uniref:1-acyl-sn-glycerol-3-phosphate acyltransferase n=1 Tax=Allocatelliglobosispora scoriae TaxID=643052 RepID=A0A841BYL6_9ACTN|nr:lysophospholipid acyltransferase family protein [Allocatelliglobosispora scoriae]MBB5871810.1 1-acyl-sn-glycerol-3-phosphate acyltransferase [Allocatelliglobosispora scoriae]